MVFAKNSSLSLMVCWYRLLTDNYGAACAISYNVLEEVELAHKLGEIETDEE